jgi:hypothetical protein
MCMCCDICLQFTDLSPLAGVKEAISVGCKTVCVYYGNDVLSPTSVFL